MQPDELVFANSFSAPLCYTFIMQRNYWPTWRNILARWGLVSPTYVLMDLTQPLLPFISQMMVIGLPLCKGAALGRSYDALLAMLGDADECRQFMDYLQEAGA
jgi:hypothetical protein